MKENFVRIIIILFSIIIWISFIKKFQKNNIIDKEVEFKNLIKYKTESIEDDKNMTSMYWP